MLKARPRVAAALAAFVLATGACGGGSKAQSGLTRVRVAFPPFLSNAVLQIAKDDGYFARQKLDVEFIRVSSPGTLFAPFLRGEVDVIPSSLTAGTLNAIARGGRVRIVADKSRLSSPTCSYAAGMVRSAIAGNIKSPADLRGLTFRAPADQTLPSEYFIDLLLKQGGLSRDDVNFENVDLPALPDAMKKGQIDLAFVSEPQLTQMVSSGVGVALFPAKDLTPDFEAGILVYGPSLLDEDPDAGRRFMVAYLQALRVYNQGATPHNVAEISKFTELDPAQVEKMCLSPISQDGTLNLDSIMTMQEWAKQNGYIDRVLTPAEFYDSSFLDQARSQLGG